MGCGAAEAGGSVVARWAREVTQKSQSVLLLFRQDLDRWEHDGVIWSCRGAKCAGATFVYLNRCSLQPTAQAQLKQPCLPVLIWQCVGLIVKNTTCTQI